MMRDDDVPPPTDDDAPPDASDAWTDPDASAWELERDPEPAAKDAEDDQDAEDDDSGEGRRPSMSTVLAQVIQERAELVHDEDGCSYAAILEGSVRRTIPVRSTEMRRLISRLAHVVLGRAPSSSVISDVITVVDGIAAFDGPLVKVALRVGEHEGRLYIDLGDDQWRAIEVSVDGWRIVSQPPIYMRRGAATRQLPMPVHGGSIEDLRKLVHVTSDDDLTLVAAHALGSLAARGPYFVLMFVGGAGSAKTSAGRAVRALTDPSKLPLRSAPTKIDDLMVSARWSAVVAFDNLSTIPEWLSDGLCCLATGGGLGKRVLYSDGEEVVIDVQRPVILTAIPDCAAGRGDLVDRMIRIELSPPSPRLKERELRKRWEQYAPSVMGSICDALVMALRDHDSIDTGDIRMADAAAWMAAGSRAWGWDPDRVLLALTEQRDTARDVSVDSNPVALAIVRLMESRDGETWTGTASDLMMVLQPPINDPHWPRTPRVMSDKVKRAAPDLLSRGIRVWSPPGRTNGRQIVIERS